MGTQIERNSHDTHISIVADHVDSPCTIRCVWHVSLRLPGLQSRSPLPKPRHQLRLCAVICGSAGEAAQTRRPVPTAASDNLSVFNTLGVLNAILGITFGHIALGQIRRTGGGDYGLALTGLVFGYVGMGVTVILLLIDLVQLAQLD
jgi:hypothetical protein